MNKRKILIIEDDITFALMLKTWLSRKGFDVTHTGNVADAQKQLSKGEFDLILSDLRLPDQEGIMLPSLAKKAKFSRPPFYHNDELCRYTIGGAGNEIRSIRLYCQTF